MTGWITDGYPRINSQEAARLVAAVQDIHVRDAAWCHIATADALHHVDLWRGIAARVDGPKARPVLGLLATAAWIAGDGTLANLTLRTGQDDRRRRRTTACSVWSGRSSTGACRPPCGPASAPSSPPAVRKVTP